MIIQKIEKTIQLSFQNRRIVNKAKKMIKIDENNSRKSSSIEIVPKLQSWHKQLGNSSNFKFLDISENATRNDFLLLFTEISGLSSSENDANLKLVTNPRTNNVENPTKKILT